MNQCEPGDRACQNVRRYYQSDFKLPSPYERIKEAVKTVKDVTKGVQETAKQVQETIDTSKHVVTTPASTLRLGKPLKPTVADLTQ